MPRAITFTSSTPIRVDPNLEPGGTPSAPNVIPWPRDEAGKLKVLSICTCGLSAKFPFCDGSHKACKDEDPSKTYAYDAATKARTEV